MAWNAGSNAKAQRRKGAKGEVEIPDLVANANFCLNGSLANRMGKHRRCLASRISPWSIAFKATHLSEWSVEDAVPPGSSPLAPLRLCAFALRAD